VQAEYSLWTRDPERELLPVLRELGTGLVAWSPLGSGFFAGSADAIGAPGEDFRTNAPRFRAQNLAANRDRFAPLRELAAQRGITPAQLALAWLLSRGEDVVPIPGTRTPAHLDENLAAAGVQLDEEALARIEEIAPAGAAAGASLLGQVPG
jgi:aryl-alcohol dehydrogenase-like predicted oxidoreductase